MADNYLNNITDSAGYFYEKKFSEWLTKNHIFQKIDSLNGLIMFEKTYSDGKTISVTYKAEKLYMIEGYETEFFDKFQSELSQILLIESAKANDANNYGYEFLINEYCEGCSEYDPHVHHFYENDNVVSTRVICEHESRCKNIYNLIKRKNEENKKQ